MGYMLCQAAGNALFLFEVQRFAGAVSRIDRT